MKLITKEVSNPEKKFWIWDEKITNKQDGRIYPHNTTNVGSGKSVAVYQLSESGKEEQIAQLEIPDYKKLEEYYWQEKEICLDYTYIDEFEWLGDKAPYEVEGNEFRELMIQIFRTRMAFRRAMQRTLKDNNAGNNIITMKALGI